jgi:DNA-binding NarL/FixJ family response regulator
MDVMSRAKPAKWQIWHEIGRLPMIRVLLIENKKTTQNPYAELLQNDPEIAWIRQVPVGSEAVGLAASVCPDIILLDIEMDKRSAGLTIAKQILETIPETKILLLTAYEDDETIIQAFELGICDFYFKHMPPEEILACVKDSYKNDSSIRPVVAKKLRSEFQRVKEQESSILYCLSLIPQLTQTELDILSLASKGYTRQQICEIRCVELSTVKSQIRKILKKFGKSNMQELIMLLNSLHIFEHLPPQPSLIP